MLVEKFLNTLRSKERSKNTLDNLFHSVVKAEMWLKKPLEDATFEEIQKYLIHIKENGYIHIDKKGNIEDRKGRPLGKSSILSVQSGLIQFYTFCFNDTDEPKYHKMLKKIKSIKLDRQTSHIQPKDILTPEEVKRLINVATLERDRCLIASIYEGGLRIGEIMALTNKMVTIDGAKQEVIFNIPNEEGCKTGSRPVLCLEIYGYVKDWMKCNHSKLFMPLGETGIRKVLIKLFKNAGIDKPCNPHMLRHSSITNACIMKMQPNQISMRYWGIPNSNMLSVYLHLSDQIVDSGYREAKGMGNNNGKVIINPLASRCVECGNLIQSGSLCPVCSKTKKLSEENETMKQQMEIMKRQMELITAAMTAKNQV